MGAKTRNIAISLHRSHIAKRVLVPRVLLPVLLWLKDLKRRALQIVSL